jgi:RimJ/RimL family protein N-acetyltransferase
MATVITTRRLRLAPHTMADAGAMNKWGADPELCHFSDDTPAPAKPEPIDATRQHLESIISRQDNNILRWGIRRLEGDRLIGYCMIAFIDRHNLKCRVGMAIGEKTEWGQGYGREVLEALVGHCFKVLGMNRIGAEIYSFNVRSIRLFEGAGFRQEGTIRQSVTKNGRYEDEYIYGLLRQEWGGAQEQ